MNMRVTVWSLWTGVALSCLVYLNAGTNVDAGELSVRFHVEEAGGVARKNAPVTGGIPFAKGALPGDQVGNLSLVDEQGKPVAFVPAIAARWTWPKGSVQWLLLDFQADFQANQKRTFTLKQGNAPSKKPQAKLAVTDAADRITINTGAISFAVSKSTFAFLPEVKQGGKIRTGVNGDMVVDILKNVPPTRDEENWLRPSPGGKEVRLSAKAGTGYKAEIEFQNALRAVIKLTGKFGIAGGGTTKARFPYIVRLTVHAGRPEVNIRHTVLEDHDTQTETIRRMGLILPLAGLAKLNYALGGQGADPLASEPEAPQRPARENAGNAAGALGQSQKVSLLAVGPPKRFHDAPIYKMARIAYSIDLLDAQGEALKTLSQGDSPKGWMAVGNNGSFVSLAMRNFWKRHPKELEINAQAKTMTAWLWPSRGNVVLDMRRYDDKKHRDAFHAGEGNRYESPNQDAGHPYGRGLTHELMVAFHTGKPSTTAFERTALALDEPLYVICEPQYYAATEVLGPIVAYDPKRFPRLEGTQDVMLEWVLRNQQDYGWYGLLDYGDILMEYKWFHMRKWGAKRKGWLCRGYSGWMQNDLQYDHMLYIQALRHGSRQLLKFAEAMTRHVAEVDTPHLEVPGFTGKTALGINDNYGRARVGGVNRHNQHHWGDTITSRGVTGHGSMLLYCLTGDLRMLEVMKEIAEFQSIAWNYQPLYLMVLARMYCVTGDDKLLRRARQLLSKQRGGFYNTNFLSNWYYGQISGDPAIKADWEQKAKAKLAYGQAQVFAYLATGNKDYVKDLPNVLKKQIYRNSFAWCDLRSAEMQDGAKALGHSQLWKRVEQFQPITPEKLLHINGMILSKWPVVMRGLEDEDFLDLH